MSFSGGFEKEAGIKHWLTAAAIAASPVKAHAGDMAGTVGKALRGTESVKTLEANANKYIDKARSIRLFGSKAAPAASEAVKGAASSAKKMSPSLDLQDGNKLKFQYGRFKAQASPKERSASFDLGKGAKLDVADTGSDKRFSIGFERSF